MSTKCVCEIPLEKFVNTEQYFFPWTDNQYWDTPFITEPSVKQSIIMNVLQKFELFMISLRLSIYCQYKHFQNCSKKESEKVFEREKRRNQKDCICKIEAAEYEIWQTDSPNNAFSNLAFLNKTQNVSNPLE